MAYAKYTGQKLSPVPAGYTSAFAQAGKNVSEGIGDLGAGIGEALKNYSKGKAETESTMTALEALYPRLEKVAIKYYADDSLSETPE